MSPRSRKYRTRSCNLTTAADTKKVHDNDQENLNKPNLRKSCRTIRKSYRYSDDSFLFETPTKHKINKNNKIQNSGESDDGDADDDSDFGDYVDNKKPTTLLIDDGNDGATGSNSGSTLYQFSTPKLRNAMSALALNTPKTPINNNKTHYEHETPKSTKSIGGHLKRTPHQDRAKLKNAILKAKIINDSASDFSPDESDYNPSDDSSESDESNEENTATTTNSDDNDSDKCIAPDTNPSLRLKITVPKTPVTRSKERSQKQNDFVLESDLYFENSKKKALTSDNTLNLLKTPRLPQNHMLQLLSSMKLTPAHENAIQELQNDYRHNFSRWLYYLNDGFNILLYGLGSKQNILQKFHYEILSKQHVIVVNGFFPSLSIKDIFDSICNEILELQQTSSGTLYETLNTIESQFNQLPETHLFLLIHNLDGIMLRNATAQNLLSRLAKITNIHLIATIDHINTPLLWDRTKLSNYNFCWWDTTTMLPYCNETAYENSLLVQNTGGLTLSSLHNVYQSLTTNARGIFLIIIRYQIDNRKVSHFQGMSIKKLYQSSCEKFLVSSDMALRSQLTEFIDHKLIKLKRSVDGTETILIPIENNLLEQFLDQQNHT